MSQSAVTVTPPNPTPPTNFSSTGTTLPNVPNFQRQNYANMANLSAARSGANGSTLAVDLVPVQTIPGVGVNQTPPPYQSGAPTSAANGQVFIANKAALTSGTSAADSAGPALSTAATGAGGTGVHATVGTYPGSGTQLTDVNDVGPVPASTSVAHEGAGTELLATPGTNMPALNAQTFVPGDRSTYAPSGGAFNWAAGDPGGPIRMASAGPALPAVTPTSPPVSPNQNHASSLSPLNNPTISATPATTLNPTTIASGTNTFALTVTGVGFTPQSVVYINGIPQATVYVNSTTLTVAAALKKATAGTLPVNVVTGGVVVTANSCNMTYS